MTTPENSAQAGQQSLSGLTVLNLGIALTMSLLMSTLLTLLSASGDIDEGLGKTSLVFPFLVILLAVATATFSFWHTTIAASREGLKNAIRLTSWILTFVTLGFGFISLILMVVVVFKL